MIFKEKCMAFEKRKKHLFLPFKMYIVHQKKCECMQDQYQFCPLVENQLQSLVSTGGYLVALFPHYKA